jgi:small subunit ribosomal protein S20
MATTISSKKRIRQNKKRNVRNKSRKSLARTQVKKVLETVGKGDGNAARAELGEAYKLIDKCGKHNSWHPNKAARMKSKLARKVGKLKTD